MGFGARKAVPSYRTLQVAPFIAGICAMNGMFVLGTGESPFTARRRRDSGVQNARESLRARSIDRRQTSDGGGGQRERQKTTLFLLALFLDQPLHRCCILSTNSDPQPVKTHRENHGTLANVRIRGRSVAYMFPTPQRVHSSLKLWSDNVRCRVNTCSCCCFPPCGGARGGVTHMCMRARVRSKALIHAVDRAALTRLKRSHNCRSPGEARQSKICKSCLCPHRMASLSSSSSACTKV